VDNSSIPVNDVDDDFTPDVLDDTYLNMELALPRSGGEVEFARVVKRLRDKDGIPIGTANDNPILDSRMYEVEFPDGYKTSMAANAIAENLFAQVDPEGNRHAVFEDIIVHRTNGKQVAIEDGMIVTPVGTKCRKQTTAGWELLVQWKDGSTTWVTLRDAKDSYPVQVAEYAVATGIDKQPAFAWWVPSTIKKRQQIISKIKSKYWIRTHSSALRFPRVCRKHWPLIRRMGTSYGGMQSVKK
jgi:hypothetical protein